MAARFALARAPEHAWPDPWVSPYRLLWGAAYSIGTAECSIMGGDLGDIPLDLSPHLKAAVDYSDELPWFRKWEASYLLTNAIFRVAAAAEKICYLVDPGLKGYRRALWKAAADRDSVLSERLPKAHDLLGPMDGVTDRTGYLHTQRDAFPALSTVASPLMCAFMQTDRDKHVAYSPLKELGFDKALAAGAFVEACELWDHAVVAMKPGSA